MTIAEYQTLIVYTLQFAFVFGVLFSLLLAFFSKRN